MYIKLKKLGGGILLATLLFGTACREVNQPLSVQNSDSAIFMPGDPGSAGMDADLLQQMEQAIERGEYPNMHSVLIYKSGQLVFENYFPGRDEIWGDSLGVIPHSREALHDIRSVSKSVVSACIGLAVEQGHIESVDQSVFDFFPEYVEYKTGLRSRITISHLLSMTSGIRWNEDVPYSDPENSEILMTASPDPMEYVLSRPMDTVPGLVWQYNGGTTQLLAAIIEKTTGQQIDSYAADNLFDPLGIAEYEWTHFPVVDRPAAASGLRLRSRDLLRFGMLYLQKGKWLDQQLLTEEWVEDSFHPYVFFGRNNNVGYGYQFWIFNGKRISDKAPLRLMTAVGNGDQRIYVDTINELIVVTTAGNYNNWTIEKNSEALLADYIYPALSK